MAIKGEAGSCFFIKIYPATKSAQPHVAELVAADGINGVSVDAVIINLIVSIIVKSAGFGIQYRQATVLCTYPQLSIRIFLHAVNGITGLSICQIFLVLITFYRSCDFVEQ